MPDIAFDFKYLHYAILVAQYGSFRAAAESLNMAQSTVSRRIRLLEHRVGVQLFERDHKGARLTPAGERFVLDAACSADRLMETIRDVRDAGKGTVGTIRIGLMTSLSSGFLRSLLLCYREALPKVQLVLEEVTTELAVLCLRCRRLDIAVLPGGGEISGCNSLPLYMEPFYLAVPKGHRLDGSPEVAWEALQEETFLVPGAQAGSELDEILLRKFSGRTGKPEKCVHYVGRENLLNMVGDGLGVSIMLESSTGIGGRGFHSLRGQR